MGSRALVLAATLIMAPLGAQSADLVVWWEKGFYTEEDEAVREIIAAFELDSGAQVELILYPQEELPKEIVAALEARQPPDFAFGYWLGEHVAGWALDDRLVDLSDAIGSFSNMFDPDQLDQVLLRNAETGQKGLYGLPMGQFTNLIHVWKSLLERAGFTLADIPREWEAFWSFWCDEVQPAVREATGRQEIWGVGLSMSPDTADTANQFLQFIAAYDADYVTRDGRLVIDDPDVRRGLVQAIESRTALFRKGCVPPDAVTWGDIDNNEQFHAQRVIMTPNLSLSIPNALKQERPNDYYENIVTIEWPLSDSGEPFPIRGYTFPAVVFEEGENTAAAKEFVRFLVREGWLAHYLNFSAERMLPSMPGLLEQPFWLDPSDPHRMAAVMQIASRPMAHDYAHASGDWRHDRIYQEWVWPKAIHRIVTEGISPEQAVDEAIARIKQILSE